jgi:phosphoglycolate phosphatase-like HAD superfamily hydrolase
MDTIPGTSIRILETPQRGKIRHALFDFDGTVSMVRDGWQDIMVPMMVEILQECGTDESVEELEKLIMHFVDHLTGKQTIYQMIRLAKEVAKRGGTPREPLEYKQMYNDRIVPVAAKRIAGLQDGSLLPDDVMVPGARALLEELSGRGVKCYLASGTDIEFVEDEASVLKIDHYFDGGIFGALPNYENFSKAMVIQKILADFDLSGIELVVIGDGYVEIENAREVDAVTVGLVSPEGNLYHMNSDKSGRLTKAGAHVLVEPDFREGKALVEYLMTS